MQAIYLYVYCQSNNGVVHFMRAYKYQAPKPDTTPSASMFLYSEKSKRYHEAYIYFMDWQGKQTKLLPEPKMFRYAITRIGLDVR